MATPGTDPRSIASTPFSPLSNNGSSPVVQPMGLSIMKPMGLSISKPSMGLSISKPMGLGLKKPAYNNDFDPMTTGLNAENTLENISTKGHRSSLFLIKRKNGSTRGLRKIAIQPNKTRKRNTTKPVVGNIYEETIQETKVYQRLKNDPEAKNYLAGFLGAGANVAQGQAYLNIDFIEGEDIISILSSLHQSQVKEFKDIIQGVVEALLWLLSKKLTHGDISNSNFRRGTDGRIRILDLGFASNIDRGSANIDMNAFYTMFTDEDIIGNMMETFPFLKTFPKPEFVYAGEDAKAKLEVYYKSVLEWLSTVEGGRRKIRKTKSKHKTTRRH